MNPVNEQESAIYLASTSPRRRELLIQMGIAHQVLQVPSPPGEDEPQWPGESAERYVIRTAREKAERGWQWIRRQHLPEAAILSADTAVILDGAVLGKPRDRAHAIEILAKLSGRSHAVHTAVCVAVGDAFFEAVSVTAVTMRTLSHQDIERYCDSEEPYGKAGAYGIQGRGGIFISHIAGSYTGVMGLPIFETADLLNRAGVI